MTLRRGYVSALTGAALTAALIAGCGSSAPSDKDLIAAIIKHESIDPASLCDHLTGGLLARLGGRSGCLQQAASAGPDSTTHATSIRLHGTSATVVEVDRNGSHTISFVKRRGVWKVAQVS